VVGVRVFVQVANKGATTSVWAWSQAPSNTKFDVKSPFWVAPTRGLNGYTNGAACVKKYGPEGQQRWDPCGITNVSVEQESYRQFCVTRNGWYMSFAVAMRLVK
jgi:hypothetical protein